MTILVTGAAGLTGGAVVQLLVARGESVLAVVRTAEQRSLIPELAEVAVADCADPRALTPLLARADSLVHMAGIHLGGALAASGELAHMKRTLAMSTSGVRSRHRASVTVYRAGEEALRAAQPRIVLVRPTMIYGSSRDRNVHYVLALAERFRALPMVGSGAALIQPIHFDDLARITVALLDLQSADPVAAGGESPITLREAAREIMRTLGLPPRLIPLPRAPLLALARGIDTIRGSRFQERVLRMTEDRSVDNAPLEKLTGIRPRTFAQGIVDQVRAMHSMAS